MRPACWGIIHICLFLGKEVFRSYCRNGRQLPWPCLLIAPVCGLLWLLPYRTLRFTVYCPDLGLGMDCWACMLDTDCWSGYFSHNHCSTPFFLSFSVSPSVSLAHSLLLSFFLPPLRCFSLRLMDCTLYRCNSNLPWFLCFTSSLHSPYPSAWDEVGLFSALRAGITSIAVRGSGLPCRGHRSYLMRRERIESPRLPGHIIYPISMSCSIRPSGVSQGRRDG